MCVGREVKVGSARQITQYYEKTHEIKETRQGVEGQRPNREVVEGGVGREHMASCLFQLISETNTPGSKVQQAE